MAIGELELSGKVRLVNGIHAALTAARAAEVYKVVIPAGYNGEIPAGVNVCRVKNLKEAFEAVRTGKGFGSVGMVYDRPPFGLDDSEMYAFDGIEGLDFLKYALAVAAAGGHHLLAFGHPGCGKSRLIQLMPHLLPALEIEERSQVERIYDLAGYVPKAGIGWNRPFRVPHQTATIEGMCGGGPRLAPGEVTLAHNGVLFLDEAAEFKSSVLQMLRVPLEGGAITLSRAGRSTVYPARFQFVMATHPCPCGNLGSKDKMCLCSSSSVEQYWRKFSGPLLNRVPIRVDCNDDMVCEDVSLDALRGKIALAYKRQMDRQGKRNQFLAPDELADVRERMTDGARRVLASHETADTPRAVSNLMKVAATVADMVKGGQTEIFESDIKTAEKLCGRLPTVCVE